jgi:hypothetical protein
MLRVQRVAIGAILLSLSPQSQSHHSFTMFDATRELTVHGTVKTLEWTSPHVWLWLVVDAGSQTAPVTYGFETLSPGQLLRDYGWDRHALNSGDKVTVAFFPLRSGQLGGALIQVTMADGRTLATRFSKSHGKSGGVAGPPQE